MVDSCLQPRMIRDSFLLSISDRKYLKHERETSSGEQECLPRDKQSHDIVFSYRVHNDS